ncbi:MAG: PilZ domain-containing protein [bacterium]|nr:PilZ domain-containing protein [bacterium]
MEFPHMRGFQRSATEMTAEIRVEGTEALRWMVCDVSFSGIYLRGEKQLPVGTICQVTIFLDGQDPPILIEASGRVVREDDDGFGIQFDSVDVDSVDHLRNLVLANSQKPGEVIEEFETHIGLYEKD